MDILGQQMQKRRIADRCSYVKITDNQEHVSRFSKWGLENLNHGIVCYSVIKSADQTSSEPTKTVADRKDTTDNTVQDTTNNTVQDDDRLKPIFALRNQDGTKIELAFNHPLKDPLPKANCFKVSEATVVSGLCIKNISGRGFIYLDLTRKTDAADDYNKLVYQPSDIPLQSESGMVSGKFEVVVQKNAKHEIKDVWFSSDKKRWRFR